MLFGAATMDLDSLTTVSLGRYLVGGKGDIDMREAARQIETNIFFAGSIASLL